MPVSRVRTIAVLTNMSLGFIETKNYVTALVASDVMVKAAHVSLHSLYKIGGARTCIVVSGDLASCQAAVNAVRDMVGVETVIIARPSEGIEEAVLLHRFERKAAATCDFEKSTSSHQCKEEKNDVLVKAEILGEMIDGAGDRDAAMVDESKKEQAPKTQTVAQKIAKQSQKKADKSTQAAGQGKAKKPAKAKKHTNKDKGS